MIPIGVGYLVNWFRPRWPFVPAFVRSRFALQFASRRLCLQIGQSFLSVRFASGIGAPQS